jgi:hypothetical protein
MLASSKQGWRRQVLGRLSRKSLARSVEWAVYVLMAEYIRVNAIAGYVNPIGLHPYDVKHDIPNHFIVHKGRIVMSRSCVAKWQSAWLYLPPFVLSADAKTVLSDFKQLLLEMHPLQSPETLRPLLPEKLQCR